MSVGSVSGNVPVQAPQQSQQAPRARDDGDGDNDALESASAKAKEAAKPVNPNLGNNVDIKA